MKLYAHIVFCAALLLSLNAKCQIQVAFSADTTVVCEGYPVQFTDESSGYNVFKWLWEFGDGEVDSNNQNPTYTYGYAGLYTVKLTASSIFLSDTSTGSLTKTAYINVRKPPQPDFSYTDSIFLPSYMFYFTGSVLNDDSYPYRYYWDFDGNGFSEGNAPATYLFSAGGENPVSLIVNSGAGCSDTVTKNVHVNDLLEAPNIFSPNGDGKNDVFIVKSNGYNEFILEIFNRWGAIVYSVTARRLQWDGRSSAGMPLPPGTYFYHITSPDVKGYNKAGVIQLVK